jgi:hypothetical protein
LSEVVGVMSLLSEVDLVTLAAQASPAAVALARSVLEQDVSDAQWSGQVGPSLTQADVARLLGKSEQAVSKDQRLLRIRNRDGRPVYPVLQFQGRGQLSGLAEVIGVLLGSLQPLTVASWLTSEHAGLGQRRPVDALRDGDVDQVAALARRLAASAA